MSAVARSIKAGKMLVGACILLAGSVMASSVQAGDTYYVYVDAAGNTHIQDTLSQEAIHFGYKVVNSRGVTVKTVPPQRRQGSGGSGDADRDRALLQSYASVADLEAARDKSLQVLQGRLDFARHQVEKLEARHKDRKMSLKNRRAQGQSVSAKARRELDELYIQLEHAEEVVIKLAVKMDRLKKRYQRDIARFKELTR